MIDTLWFRCTSVIFVWSFSFPLEWVMWKYCHCVRRLVIVWDDCNRSLISNSGPGMWLQWDRPLQWLVCVSVCVCECHFSERKVNTVLDSQPSADFTRSSVGLKPEPHPSLQPDTAVGVQAGLRVSVPMHLLIPQSTCHWAVMMKLQKRSMWLNSLLIFVGAETSNFTSKNALIIIIRKRRMIPSCLRASLGSEHNLINES